MLLKSFHFTISLCNRIAVIRFCYVSLCFLAGCATQRITGALPPWRIMTNVAETAPHDKPALWTDGTHTLLAWPGEPASPSIRLANVDSPGRSRSLTLGRIPRDVSLFTAADGLLHLMWLDQTLPGQTQLVGALIDTEGNTQRIPGVISNRPAVHYAGISTPDHGVLTLWAGEHELYAQTVDARGRPRPALRIARTGRRPVAAYDSIGNLHMAWLEPTAPEIWTIRYLYLPKGALPANDDPPALPIGVIHSADVLESFVMGTDAQNVYLLWTTVQIGDVQAAKLAGLTFPLNDNTAVNSIAPLAGARWPDVADQPQPVLTLGVTLDGQQPAALNVTPTGFSTPRPVYASSALIGATALAVTPGQLNLGWTETRANGTATIYYATTR